MKRTLEINENLRVPVGETGRFTEVDLTTISNKILAHAVLHGFTSAINDVSRGKDERGEPNSDAIWSAARDKRADHWQRGFWNRTKQGRAAAIVTRMQDAYIAEQLQMHKTTIAAVKDYIKNTIADVFGADERVSFPRYLDALAHLDAKANDSDETEVRHKLEDKYLQMAVEKAAGAAKLDLSNLNL